MLIKVQTMDDTKHPIQAVQDSLLDLYQEVNKVRKQFVLQVQAAQQQGGGGGPVR